LPALAILGMRCNWLKRHAEAFRQSFAAATLLVLDNS